MQYRGRLETEWETRRENVTSLQNQVRKTDESPQAACIMCNINDKRDLSAWQLEMLDKDQSGVIRQASRFRPPAADQSCTVNWVWLKTGENLAAWTWLYVLTTRRLGLERPAAETFYCSLVGIPVRSHGRRPTLRAHRGTPWIATLLGDEWESQILMLPVVSEFQAEAAFQLHQPRKYT